MPLVQWKDEYSVGIDAVDYEHKQLIELINRLGEELAPENSKLTVPAFFLAIYREESRLILHFTSAFEPAYWLKARIERRALTVKLLFHRQSYRQGFR